MNNDIWVSLILLCYAAPVVFAVRMHRRCIEAYERLPEKIPIHFGIAGTVDGWAKKSRLSVFWIVWFTIGLNTLLFVTLFYLPMRKDPWYEMMFAGGLMNACIGYMFHRINDGVLDVALGKASNIWPYMKIPLALVLISSLLMTSPVLIGQKPTLVSGVFCETVNRAGEPVAEKNGFISDDRFVTIYLRWKFLNGRHVIRYEWYDPAGKLVSEFEYRPDRRHVKKSARAWSYINMAGTQNARKTGTWKVEVFLDGKHLASRNFKLKR